MINTSKAINSTVNTGLPAGVPLLSACYTPQTISDRPQVVSPPDVTAPMDLTTNNAPFWTKNGACVYRVSTPDNNNFLPYLEQGVEMTSNLLDSSVPQILILNGIIGHDHPGNWNWDGCWPYWGRTTLRANNDWKVLSDFMVRTRDNSNAFVSFHVNLTDVNIGLRDYPETFEFFKKLVAAKAIYRRDWDAATLRRIDPPYIPQEIDKYISINESKHEPDPVDIFALVDYKNFWDSGLAKEMLDDFYEKLPYSPPILYLDVLNLSGGNFETGFPDGPLGGSEETQLEGAINIIDYLCSKGTDLGTEGDRPCFGKRAGYVWLHGKGFSEDDYSVISGGNPLLASQQVFGSSGAFHVAPVALTASHLAAVQDHYKALLAEKPGTKKVAGLDTFHIAFRSNATDEFDLAGSGDPFRGDWADLVNNFYLSTIQEQYHIGNQAVRTSTYDNSGVVRLGKYQLIAADGKQTEVSVPDFVEGWKADGARKSGEARLYPEQATKATVAAAGNYSLRIAYKAPGHKNAANLNVYASGVLVKSFVNLPRSTDDKWLETVVDEIPLKAGENIIAFDCGAVRATWSDGTEAEWTTPYLRKGFTAKNGDIVLADDFNRMWPDTWSGQQKIYFFSWDGTDRSWKLPAEWASEKTVALYPLTPGGRGEAVTLAVNDGSIAPKLLPQVPYIVQ